MMKRILTLGLCLLLAAGTACAETISDIGSYHSGWLSYLCTMPDGRILMGGGETDGTDSISSHAILVCLNTDRSVCWKKTLSAGTADNSISLGTVLEDGTIAVVQYDKVWNKKVLFFTQDGTFTGKEFAIPEEYTDYAAEPSFLMVYRTRGNDPAETLLLDWNGNVTARYDGMIMKDGIGDLIRGKNELIIYGNDSQDKYHAKLQKMEGVSDRDGKETWIVDRGTPGMATAGSGDVLSGILAAVTAAHPDELAKAAAGAAWINGRAGETAALKYGEAAMTAGDTAGNAAEVIRALEAIERQVRK